tara:strand:- start:1 stop:726 length:726 start_codon:yes stop_codon:yes gene_type:complete
MDNNSDLDVAFEYIRHHITYDVLWKVGVYYSQIMKLGDELHNNSHGVDIETLFRHLLKAKNITDKELSLVRNKGQRELHDFILPEPLSTKIQNKTIIRNGGLYRHFDGLKDDRNALKIIDTSRRSNQLTSDYVINEFLTNLTEDFNIMMYVYDIKNNRGCLALTSLYEMGLTLLNSKSNEQLSLMISYNGSCQYFLNRRDVYLTAKSKNRLIEFSLPKEEEKVLNYIKFKSNPESIVDKIL